MYKLISIETRMVEPHEAEQFSKINTFPGQRKKDMQQARYYKEAMETNRMRCVNIATGELPDGRLKYLMNGQHVSEAILLLQRGHLATVERYLCETEQDFSALYATFDSQKVRSQEQVFRGARMFLSDTRLRDVPLAILTVCGGALVYLDNGVDGTPNFCDHKRGRFDKNSKTKIVDNHGDAVMFVRRFAEKRYMINTGAVTSIISTWRANPEKAAIFWDMVATGLGFLGDDHPAYSLREKLLEGIIVNGKYGGGNKRARVNYTYCTLHWNSWIRGETRKRVKKSVMKSVPCTLAAA